MSIDQSKRVTEILKALKNVGIATSQVEDELPIAKGYLWKVKSGLKFLTEDRLVDLEKYYAKNCKKVVHQTPVCNKKTVVMSKKHPVISKIEIKEAKPGSLADMMREARSAPGREVAAPYKRSKI